MESSEAKNFDLQKTWLSIKRRWLPAAVVFSCVVVLAAVHASSQKPTYSATGKLLLKKVNQTSALTGLGEQLGQLSGVSVEKSDPLKTESEVISSVPVAQKTIAELNLKDAKGKPLKPQALASRVKVKELQETDVLQVSFQSTNPSEAAAVVNTLMHVYIESNVLTNRSEAVAAVTFIANQLPETESTVHRAEVALRKFKEKNHTISLDGEAKSQVTAIQDLDSKIVETQASLADATARSRNLQEQVGLSPSQAMGTNSLNQSAGVQKVLAEIQQLEDQLAVQRTRFRETYPTIVNLKLQEATLKTLLKKRVRQTLGSVEQLPNGNLQIGESKQRLIEEFAKSEVERSGLASRLAKLTNAQATYKQRVKILPRLEEDQRELQRQLDAAQSTYELLLKKLQEVRVAENQNLGNARIIEPASIPEQASPIKSAIILIVGGMLGVLLAVATVFVLEVRDTSIKNLKEAKELFGYTLIGAIPTLKKKATPRSKDTESTVPELPVRDTPRSPVCEAYRMLQANLKFLSSDKALQVIVVTSSVPKEGKSKVSANLAATIAQLERRVLLVDADMRHPMQHHIWELTNTAGLSDVIVGQAEFETIVNRGMANLDVLTAGVIPPNPLALLDSKRMASLIEYFSEHYDFVIIDAPPLVVAADALVLSKMTDGVLLVARPGVLDSNSADVAKDLLERSGQNVLGLVVNGANLESDFYYAKAYSMEEEHTVREEVTSNR